ncbi:hypothetical protein [Streptomyces sp. MB09-02B]|uniref:hypothetical protein n=1 Tax=Streptomyces sp. MB09-02B TaxID=3028667 RepID=UPI0029A45545|nr:hypothetical protein [Streptomyces sp. MB09-02B]MDX3640366.1 hypothetical protein [Streptomyces sp. MB09-02B]
MTDTHPKVVRVGEDGHREGAGRTTGAAEGPGPTRPRPLGRSRRRGIGDDSGPRRTA